MEVVAEMAEVEVGMAGAGSLVAGTVVVVMEEARQAMVAVTEVAVIVVAPMAGRVASAATGVAPAGGDRAPLEAKGKGKAVTAVEVAWATVGPAGSAEEENHQEVEVGPAGNTRSCMSAGRSGKK